MPHWLLKAGGQGVVSVLPGGRTLNRWLQAGVTRSTRFQPAEFERKLASAEKHLGHARKHGRAAGGLSCLELGTGWYPVVPVALWLGGASSVETWDIDGHVSAERIRTVFAAFVERWRSNRLADLLPSLKPERLAALTAILESGPTGRASELLKAAGVRAFVGDVRLRAPSAPRLDLIVSDETLEHVAPGLIDALFRKFREVAAPGAVMSHFINLQDHYASFDNALSPYHFLRYSPAGWRLFNNRLQYQNRLRQSEYEALHAGANWRVISAVGDRGTAADLAALKIHADFGRFAPEDLLVKTSWLVSVPA